MQPIFAIGLPHGTDFIWLFLLAVLLFGANKLPQLARGLGKSLGEFKKAKDEFEKEIHSATTTEEAKKAAEQPRLSNDQPLTTLPPAQAPTPIDAPSKTT